MSIDTAERARQAADILLSGWRDPSHRPQAFPTELQPKNIAEAYAVQEAVIAAQGQIGGWKVGAAGPEPDAACNCAPMPLSGIHRGPARLPSAVWPMRGVEAEISFRMGTTLEPRDKPYTREEVLAAIDTCHPAIEVIQSRFADRTKLDPWTLLADSNMHGCFVHGAEVQNWRALDFAQERVRLLVSGKEAVTRVANPAGDMIRLVQWLANEGARWAGGLQAGQFVTTGSWTGITFVDPGAPVQATFEHAGAAELVFE
jgi:2-keto-4-pentenoate hydratase